MNTNILHILNGDSTREKFESLELNGQIMVWREVLVQGPLFYQVDSELFWDMRAQFMELAFDAKLSGYKKKVINEFKKLRQFKGGEIVLWFEYDLFCQINMVALLSYILRKKKNCKVSLICVGDYPGYSERVGLGQIPSADYIDLFEKRIELHRSDLLLADKAWMLFCGKQLEDLEVLESDKLIYLKGALNDAKKLFAKNGSTSELEDEILELAKTSQKNKKQLVGELLRQKSELGFGDMQYEYILSNLGIK